MPLGFLFVLYLHCHKQSYNVFPFSQSFKHLSSDFLWYISKVELLILGQKVCPSFTHIARLPTRKFNLHTLPQTPRGSAHPPSEEDLQVKDIFLWLEKPLILQGFFGNL